ncbi:MAG: helix-turn-helix domain-containing protein [Candidatus Thorarchaeota archaeon]
MRADLERAFSKLMNPRMSAGLMILHSLLSPLRGPPIPPKEVRETVEKLVEQGDVSKQSITNAARRLEEANIVVREEGYSVNYGYLLSVLLDAVMDLTARVNRLEEELESISQSQS